MNPALIRTFETRDKFDELNIVFRGNYKLNFNNRLGDKDLIILLSCLEEFKDYIKHIDLSYNNISDSGAEALSKILPRLINLESLNLSSN